MKTPIVHVFSDRILHARGALEMWLIGAETIRPILYNLLPDAVFQTRAALDAVVHRAEALVEAAAALGRDRLLAARAVRGRLAPAP